MNSGNEQCCKVVCSTGGEKCTNIAVSLMLVMSYLLLLGALIARGIAAFNPSLFEKIIKSDAGGVLFDENTLFAEEVGGVIGATYLLKKFFEEGKNSGYENLDGINSTSLMYAPFDRSSELRRWGPL